MSELHTVKCDVCQIQKPDDQNGWYVIDYTEEGVVIDHAPKDIAQTIEFQFHLCGLEHALQKASYLLAQPSVRETPVQLENPIEDTVEFYSTLNGGNI